MDKKQMIDFSGKRGLVLGVGNQRSIAWAVVERLHQQGAELGLTFLRDPKAVLKLMFVNWESKPAPR